MEYHCESSAPNELTVHSSDFQNRIMIPFHNSRDFDIFGKSHSYYFRIVHGSDGPAGRVGSGRATILPDFGGSGHHFGYFIFFTDYFLVPKSKYESSNTAFGLIDFLRYFNI